jgi:ERCC4-type nuclease
MQLNIDYREHALLERIKVEPKTLILGDVSIEKDGVELLIIERKTISDLASSICDGRYKEQSFRLNECGVPNHNILYLIEGSLNTHMAVSKKVLLSSLMSLWYHKGFTVFHTENVDDNAEFVQTLFEKLQKDDSKPHVQSEYACTVKKQKRDKITPDNIDVIMLSQIPGISTTTATALLEEYKTVFGLERALKESGTCLDAFMCGKRKMSKKCIENIKLYFHI